MNIEVVGSDVPGVPGLSFLLQAADGRHFVSSAVAEVDGWDTSVFTASAEGEIDSDDPTVSGRLSPYAAIAVLRRKLG